MAPGTRSESGESEGGFWGRFPRKNDMFLLQETSTFEKTLKLFLCLIVDWFFVIYVHSVGMIVVYFLIESKVKPNQSILVIWQIEKSDWWPLLAFFTCGMPMSLSRLSFIGRVGQSRILRKPISKFTLQWSNAAMGNPRMKWRFLAGKTTATTGDFSIARFGWRVTPIC